MLKLLKIPRDESFYSSINREINNYLYIEHAFIPKYYGKVSFKEKDKNYLVIEYINGQELKDCIEKKQLNPNEKINIIFQIMITIEYFHMNQFIYRDLKNNNILITEEKKDAVIIDFDHMISFDTFIENKENYSYTNDFCSVFRHPEINEGTISYDCDIY